MFFKKHLSGILCVFLGLCFFSCQHRDEQALLPSVIPSELEQGGIVLTFDDDGVDNWVEILPLLDSFQVKATFYVSGYNTFNLDKRKKLRSIQEHGHEIAYHSLTHPNLKEYLKHRSVKDYMRYEISDGLNSMGQNWFFPVNFAYPYGVTDDSTTAELLKVFRSVRTVNYQGTLPCVEENIFIKRHDTRILNAIGLDNWYRSDMRNVEKGLQRARDEKSAMMFLCHLVKDHEWKSDFVTPREKLLKLLHKSRSLGLRSYRVMDIIY